MYLRRPPARSRPGHTLAVVTILLVGLVGMLSLAIDIGYIALVRTELQRSADAGALAAVVPTAVVGSASQDLTTARAEARRFVQLNQGTGFTVPDADVEFGVYDPATGLFTTTAKSAANAARVTARRDATANTPLRLFFGPVVGRTTSSARASAVAFLVAGGGVKAGPDLLPYAVQVDYFFKAAGLPPRPGATATVDTTNIVDKYTPRDNSQAPLAAADGKNEVVLFGSSKTAPGNFGSVDIGTASNGTPELVRQILYGPTAADFANKNFAPKVSADGSLKAPLVLGADPGISNGTESAWEAIVGQRRIIPLYSTAAATGNNTTYDIVGFAAVVVVAVDMHGNPKRIWAQPTGMVSDQVTPLGMGQPSTFYGVSAPPRLAIPRSSATPATPATPNAAGNAATPATPASAP